MLEKIISDEKLSLIKVELNLPSFDEVKRVLINEMEGLEGQERIKFLKEKREQLKSAVETTLNQLAFYLELKEWSGEIDGYLRLEAKNLEKDKDSQKELLDEAVIADILANVRKNFDFGSLVLDFIKKSLNDENLIGIIKEGMGFKRNPETRFAAGQEAVMGFIRNNFAINELFLEKKKEIESSSLKEISKRHLIFFIEKRLETTRSADIVNIEQALELEKFRIKDLDLVEPEDASAVESDKILIKLESSRDVSPGELIAQIMSKFPAKFQSDNMKIEGSKIEIILKVSKKGDTTIQEVNRAIKNSLEGIL